MNHRLSDQTIFVKNCNLLQMINRVRKSYIETHRHRDTASIARRHQKSIDVIEIETAQLEHEVKDHIVRDPDLKNDLDLLTSIPAAGERTGLLMLGLLRSHEITKASQASAYVGLVPVQYQSGSSVRGRSPYQKQAQPRSEQGYIWLWSSQSNTTHT
jgi:transposase